MKIDIRPAQSPKQLNTKIYVFIRDAALQADTERALCLDACRKAIAALGLPASTPARFSRTAGCSCGCSPGYVVKGGGKDVFVNVRLSDEIQAEGMLRLVGEGR